MPKRSANLPAVNAPPWEILQERVLALLNEHAEENPAIPDALLLTGAGLAYVTFAATRYGDDAFQTVYENLRSIVELFQLIIEDERKGLPRRPLKDSTKKKALIEKWEVLESVRKKLNALVEDEIKRLQNQNHKPN